MTALNNISFPTAFRRELPSILPLFGPILISQYANIINGVIDTAFAARLGTIELGGVALGVALWLPIYMFVIGVLVSVLVTVSQHVGCANMEEGRKTAHQGLWFGLSLGLLSSAITYALSLNIAWFGVTGELIKPTQAYLQSLMWGLPFAGMAATLRFYCEAQGKVFPVTVMSVLTVCFNVLFKYGLMFGNLGMPKLGIAGCGIATALGMCAFFLMLAGYITWTPVQATQNFFTHFSLPKHADISQLAKLGIPIGISITSEFLIFSVISFFISTSGAVALGAHQVTFSCMMFFFATPSALCLASSIRIGTLHGQHNAQALRQAVVGIVTLAGLIGMAYSGIMFFAASELAAFLTQDVAVIFIAAGLIQIAAFFQFSDAIQICFVGILRGVGDTVTPFLMTSGIYWLFCIPLGYVISGMPLPFGLHVSQSFLGIQGWWIALSMGLTMVSILLGLRVYKTFWLEKKQYNND